MTESMLLDIESIAAGGNGVARCEGLVVFVPRTAPGDRVRALVERSKSFGRGLLESVEKPSPDRVTPACPHYDGDSCGGCQLQHVNVDTQTSAKQAIIRDAFRRIGKRTIELPPIHSGPSPWRYRHRLSLALRRSQKGEWRAGLHAYDDASVVFDLKDCHITDTRVLAYWSEVMRNASLLPEERELRGTIRLVGESCAFALEGGSTWSRAEEFARNLAHFAGVWWTPEGGRRRVIRSSAAAGASFAQVNPDVASTMLDHVHSAVIRSTPSHVVDAYAGSGDLTARLHANGIRATAIELDEEAAALAASRIGAPSRAIAAKVEDAIGSHLPADVVVLNPPRAGVDRRVAVAIEKSGATRRLVYVSCDPATLARDVALMPSWNIERVTAFDMFPQTAHVETVVELARAAP